MNDKIRELGRQATLWCVDQPNQDDFDAMWEEKFAELIVRECMSVARGMRNPPNLNYKPSDRFVDELRLHFGVSE